MEFKDIIQVNSTLIAGFLILLTISSFLEHSFKMVLPQFAYGVSIAFLGVSMIAAIIGQIIFVKESLKDKWLNPFRAFCLVFLAGGVLFLVWSIIQLL